MSDSLLIIFARNPELGKVKTRLAKTIGDTAALDIYRFLVAHTREITVNTSTDKVVYYSEYIPDSDLWDKGIYRKALQVGDDLGACMENAFRDAFRAGYEKVVIIGSDIFNLTQSDIEMAFDGLSGHDYVIGPAQDGGYYLLGMKSPDPVLFRNMDWGSDTVLQSTLKVLEGHTVKLLETRNDIDYYEDIRDEAVFQPFLNNTTQIS